MFLMTYYQQMDKLVIKFLKHNKLKQKNQEGSAILKENSKIVNYLLNTKEPYILEVDNMQVEIEYCETDKKFKDCMVNILKQKIGK